MAVQKISKFLQKIFGSRNERLLKVYWRVVEQVKELEPKYRQMPDSEFGEITARLRKQLADGQTQLDILGDAFAAIREASDRHLGIRNVLVDEYEFDATQLSITSKATFDKLKAQLEEGTALDALEVPVEFNEEIRKLYPESRPPFRFRHFDVQVIGGKVLFEGKIAEMATGEGKTLVATLAAYLVNLTGRKVHVITVNDYLAKRDAEWMTPVFGALGMTVGAIQSDMDTSGQNRQAQYACDITYGTNNEFGFDYLRDNMKVAMEDMAQGPLDFAIIDEVDSILVDEARTPLIISGPARDDVNRYKKADAVAMEIMKLQSTHSRLKKQIDDGERTIANAHGEIADAKKAKDSARIEKAQAVIEKSTKQLEQDTILLENTTEYYEVEYDRKAVHLVDGGIGAAQDLVGAGSFYTGSNIEWPHMLEQSLRAHVTFEREKDYIVKEGKVVIVDEFTGRLMDGRQWSDGLHQAVEAKERVQIKEETQTLATITLQNFFKLYGRLSGMTGTAITEAGEFMDIYGLDVILIPTNRPCIRDDRNDMIYKTMREKFHAIVDEIYEVSTAGCPVLVGTISIEKSEAISKALTQKYSLDHEVLNAKQHEREAIIVTKAGFQHARRDGKMIGNVTIATNMAGRGTDIKLGEGVADIGGLHIVGTERHEARRIDNQLRGRAGRQGDAGSSQFFLCFEDDLMQFFGGDKIPKLLALVGWQEGEPIYNPIISRQIEKVQKKVEERNFEIRKSLLDYDEVMDYQRKIFYSRRRSIIAGENLKDTINDMIDAIVPGACDNILSDDYPASCIVEWAGTNFGVEIQPRNIKGGEQDEIEKYVKDLARKNAADDISRSLGEYLEDYSDQSTWNIDALCKWAMSTFGASLSASKLRQMDHYEIEKTIIGAASEQVDRKDCSQLVEFAKEDFSRKTFVQWMQTRFDIELSLEELEGMKNAQIQECVLEKIAAKYTQREISYPVEFAMNMAFGPQGPNVYAFEALAEWANKKYCAEFTAEWLQHTKPQVIHDKLIELSTAYNNGRLGEVIDSAMASNSGEELIAWAHERFDTSIDDDLADGEKLREKLIASGRNFLRAELADLEKYVLLQIYDSVWKNHLYGMDHLKEGIFLRAYAERDPKIEYKQEGFRMFSEMLETIDDRVTDTIFKVRLEAGVQRRNVWNVSNTEHAEVDQFSMAERQRAAAVAPQGERKVKQIKLETPKVGRNEPCPCGSGSKYKKCCGKND
ncbi:MAG: preprotein translocase subunit SecA [Planctomycetes bacterium]|nr:preprotein translocase subunit SecA [Planctomycetota bacterium]